MKESMYYLAEWSKLDPRTERKKHWADLEEVRKG